MKVLVDRLATSPAFAIALDDLRHYLRITPDMGDIDDAELTRLGRAAAAEVEQFAQVALLDQTIRVTILDLAHGDNVALPVGPVADGSSATVTVDGQPFTGFDLVTGLRPYLIWAASIRGKASACVVIEYPAGFGDKASDVPPDLAQAILDHAALTYDQRVPTEAKVLSRSPHLARVGARYRGVSV